MCVGFVALIIKHLQEIHGKITIKQTIMIIYSAQFFFCRNKQGIKSVCVH